MNAAPRLWPVDPVLAATSMPRTQLSRLARVDTAVWSIGSLTDAQADRVAVALGEHPVSLWPGWFDAEIADPSLCGCGSERVWAGRWICRPCDRRKSARRRERVKVAS